MVVLSYGSFVKKADIEAWAFVCSASREAALHGHLARRQAQGRKHQPRDLARKKSETNRDSISAGSRK
jgi:hypothetical protein